MNQHRYTTINFEGNDYLVVDSRDEGISDIYVIYSSGSKARLHASTDLYRHVANAWIVRQAQEGVR